MYPNQGQDKPYTNMGKTEYKCMQQMVSSEIISVKVLMIFIYFAV